MSDSTPSGRFQPTLWSVVRRAADRDDPAGAREAMAEFCRCYWKPVYAYMRRAGRQPADAEDLAQEFFTRLIEREGLAGVDPARGRFRNYLLGALRHFLSNRQAAERAQKRGGGRGQIPIEAALVEPALVDSDTPERAFERAWTRELLEAAWDRLRQTLEAEGNRLRYDVLRRGLDVDRPSYREIAAALGISESEVTNHLHRGKQRFREALIAVVLPTASSLQQARAEIDELLLSAKGPP